MKNELMSLLKNGKQNAVTKKELAVKLRITERAVRCIVNQLRLEGMPVISSSQAKGYWLGDDTEVIEFANEQRRRGLECLRVVGAIKKGIEERKSERLI